MKKNKSKFTVLRSGQEKRDYWTFLEDDYCKGTIQCPIETGDYMIKELPPKTFTIERKNNTSEIYGNLFEQRFNRELERLMEFKYRYIICQFEAKDVLNFPVNSGMPAKYWHNLKANGNFIMSKLTYISIKMNIPVLFAGPGEPAKTLAMSYMKQVARLEGLV